jgi:Urease, gamma subunit
VIDRKHRQLHFKSATRQRGNSVVAQSEAEMKLTPQEFDKLKLCNAGFIAQKRLARGIRLVSRRKFLEKRT